MTGSAANGRTIVFADIEGRSAGGSAAPSPITHTMGGLSPLTHTMLDPVYGTLPPPPTTPQEPSDIPLDGKYFDDQWHFDFLGDIEKIWEEYGGAGVNVGVYDDAVQTDHPDLIGNYNASLEVLIDGQVLDGGGGPSIGGWAHGTAVAGLIAASRNEFGTTGVAWGASITGVPVLDMGVADMNSNHAGFLQALDQLGNFDIVNNSWGRLPGFWQGFGVPEQDAEVLDRWFEALETGRDGLGTIQVKAAGNDNWNANGDLLDQTRASIIVGAYDDTGDAAYYSNYGANLLVSAPSSGGTRGIVTTDLSGYDGWNMNWGTEFDPVELEYTDLFGGTSAATPIVSGVIALMLEANPDLGWRDVQNILTYSAREIGSGVGGERTADEGFDWRYNGANNWNGGGLHYSEDYGYGSVDAFNAVRMSEVWGLFAAPQASANETSYSSQGATNVALDDLTTTDILFAFDGSSFDVESVSVDLTITHGSESLYLSLGQIVNWLPIFEATAFPVYLSDLEIYLISPDGTVTTLADFTSNDYAVDNSGLDDGWHSGFNANAFRGEDGIGTWTIRIVDAWQDDVGVVNSAQVTLHGRDGDAAGQNLNDDVYHYTNEVFTTLARDGTRQSLTDGNGGSDWLNMAAMSGNLVVNLGAGATSTANSLAFLTIAAATDIENAVTGDGNDIITGNDLANRLHGMRGNDIIDGGAGGDTLSGGAGNDALTGGIGLDYFLFDRALNDLTNVDIITDFSHLDDAIWLDATIFAGLSLGTLGADAFFAGSSAQDELDRIIYDSVTGALYYDADGSGALGALQFATIMGSPDDLAFDDFVVIDEDYAPLTPADDRTATAAPTTTTSGVDEVFGDGTPIFGTDDDENIRTKHANDRIFGFGGNDDIVAGAGDDFIDAGQGLDSVMAGDGNDIVYGGDSPDSIGDYLYGQGGDDILFGADQPNDFTHWLLGAHGDLIDGGDGNDTIYGFAGDDWLSGGDGNDLIIGGTGSDSIGGGGGDDRIIVGEGERNHLDGGSGIDTIVFTGNSTDYRIYKANHEDQVLRIERIDQDGEYRHMTSFAWTDVERLEFDDVTLDIGSRSLTRTIFDPGEGGTTFQGWEISLFVYRTSGTYVINEEGPFDRLQHVQINNSNFGEPMAPTDVTINSDALSFLQINGLTGSVTVNAAAGERELHFNPLSGFRLREQDVISDDTATSILMESQYSGEPFKAFNAAGVNGYNLSFASATTFKAFDIEPDISIQWNAPNLTTIDLGRTFDRGGSQIGIGSAGRMTFETALDDSILMTAGATEEFRFISNDLAVSDYEHGGSERIRFGNLGGVNLSNDGTVGDEAGMNAGLSLRGTIDLKVGSDEVWVLGTGAFQGGTVDAGSGMAHSVPVPESDTLRMTFGVAAAIGDISEHISNFEVLRLDTPHLTGQVVDITKFDTLSRILITGGTQAGGDNTVTNIVDNSAVTIASGTKQEQAFFAYETFGNQFGTIHLDMAGDGEYDTLNLSFIGYAIDSYSDGARPMSLDEGTIHVVDAETVNITTESFDAETYIIDQWGQPIDMLSYEATDPFAQVLDLDVATTVTLSGETGWDFTVAGTDIGKVTLLDASGITGTGAIGAVKATAQTSEGVTFKGGWGDDELTGGAGDDTLDGGGYGNDLLDGGAGSDTAVFAGNWADYAITIADGVVTLANPNDGTTDTVKGTELFEFADRRVSAANLLTGEGAAAPTDIALSNAAIAELSDDGTVVGTLSATDPDGAPGQAFTYELVDDADGRFAVLGDQLVVADGAAIDYEMAASHAVTVKVTDSDGLSFEKTLTIAVGDANDTPAVALANATASIAENTSTASRIKVADIVVADDAIGSNRLSLTGRDAKFFEIIGMALFLKAGVELDYEQRQSLQVAVAVDDDEIEGSPDATSDTYVLAIGDVADQNVITGTPGDNTLNGTSGDDFFDGRGGKDTFKGGRGDDVYVVDSSDDKVIEVSGQGIDTVLSSATKYTLAANVNNLTLTGDGSIDGTGNASSNVILGNAGNNKLSGGAGDDTIDGGAGDDIMDGGIGNDTLSYASADSGITFSLAIKSAQATGGAGTDTAKGFQNLTGSGYADTLAGDGGKNVLDGGADADDMSGGKGDDTYVVDNADDAVHELARQGTDTVRSSALSFTLGANVENATLIGNGVEAVGNDLANMLTGNALANILTGGAGKDVFVFNAALGAGNVDAITDFNAADDTIHIDNAAFASVGRNGGLSYFAFTTGAEAHDRNDRIIYDDDTGALYYDADGSGSGDQVQFATLDANLNLTYKDFYVV